MVVKGTLWKDWIKEEETLLEWEAPLCSFPDTETRGKAGMRVLD